MTFERLPDETAFYPDVHVVGKMKFIQLFDWREQETTETSNDAHTATCTELQRAHWLAINALKQKSNE